MHLVCQQQTLATALSTVNRAISSRSTLPILANVLLTGEQHTLTLSATNLEMSIVFRLEAEIPEPGQITLPAKLLSELIHSLSSGSVEILVPSGSITAQITTVHNHVHLKGMDVVEFPSIPSKENTMSVMTLDAALLKEIISQVAFAAADDESRPVLTGILVQFRETQISLAAADAFRLAFRQAEFEPGEGELGLSDVLIPAKALIELARILPSEGQVEMTLTPNRNQILFHTPDLDLVSRLIDGTFPPYQSIIPPTYTTRAVLGRLEFAAALKSATFFTDSNYVMQISIQIPEQGNGIVRIDANSENKGDGISTLVAEVEGPAIEMIFSSKQLTEALSAIRTPQVAFEVTTKSKPGVLRPVGEQIAQQFYIVMPMNKL